MGALLGIEPLRERPSMKPFLRWKVWRIILKNAILAKESISIHRLREAPPDNVTFHPETIYEEDVDNSTAQNERDRRNCNVQLKYACLNKCQSLEAAGILCGYRPWKFCDAKAVSPTYVSLDTEGSWIFGSQDAD